MKSNFFPLGMSKESLCINLCIGILSVTFYSCKSNKKQDINSCLIEEQIYEQSPTSCDYSPTQMYTLPAEDSKSNDISQEKPKIDQNKNKDVIKVAASTISRWYQEGYDRGYDEGEDDALHRNGYEAQFDDACRYKGQKRKDYQLGYIEGYEAGYYDNVKDNGDDDEYE